MPGIKRTKHDAIFSDCIRERSGWTCEYSGKEFPIGFRRGLECAHIWGRRNKSVRWEPMNCVALSTAAHMHFTANPLEFHAWLLDVKGESFLEILNEKKNLIKKWTKAEKEEMYKHYKNEFRIMEEKRAEGQTGWLEFVGYE